MITKTESVRLLVRRALIGAESLPLEEREQLFEAVHQALPKNSNEGDIARHAAVAIREHRKSQLELFKSINHL